MALDRDETLRKAEKLLRQGNLAAAITEYARVAESYPSDIPTLNKLGELYQRAGQTDDAVGQFARVADQWLREGEYAKASGHYKKILKLKPQDESAILQLVQASIRQGLLTEAKGYLQTARAAREARGDAAGAEDLTLQLADLDPNDFDSRMIALRVRLNRDATPELVAEVRRTINELERKGRSEESEVLLASLIRLDPDDVDARVRVARAAMRRGDMAAARAALPAHPEESQRYEVLAMAVELELTLGQTEPDRLEGVRPLLTRLLAIEHERAREDIAALGERMRAPDLAVTFACVESLVDDHAAKREFADAADRLKQFLRRAGHHVPALLRLVEVCVDGDLDADTTVAQGHLCDAYLEQGEALKARVIAEDLLSRRPRSARERDRLRRALVALGDEDPDAAIADHLGFVEGLIDGLPDEWPEHDDEPVSLYDPSGVAAAAEPALVETEAAHVDHAPVHEAPVDQPPVDQIGIEETTVEALIDDMAMPMPVEAAPEAPELAYDAISRDEAIPEIAVPHEHELSHPPDLHFEEPDLALAAGQAGPDLDAPDPGWHGESGIAFEPVDFSESFQDAPLAEAPAAEPLRVDAVSSEVAAPAAAPQAPAPPTKGKKAKGKKASQPAKAKPAAPAKPVADEIDLTGALDALARGVDLGDVLEEADPDGVHGDDDAEHDEHEHYADEQVAAGPAHAPAPAQPVAQVAQTNGAPDDVDLEQVFDGLRAEAAGDMVEMAQPDLSARLLSMAETYQAAGMFEEARAALEQVSSDSRYRFRAAAALGQLFWQQGDPDGALRWLELASEAPAPDRDAGRAVMYDFAEKLEQTGDTTRALAVFLDLLADQGDYRDVRERVDRLTRVQTG